MTLSNCRSVALCDDFRHMQKSYSFSYTTKTCVFGLTNIISQQTFLFGYDINLIEFPASVIRQVSVHGVDFPGKQHGFFPSNSTVYLHNDLVVLGDRRQHKFYHLWICAASRIYILSSSKTFNQSGICLMTMCQLAKFFFDILMNTICFMHNFNWFLSFKNYDSHYNQKPIASLVRAVCLKEYFITCSSNSATLCWHSACSCSAKSWISISSELRPIIQAVMQIHLWICSHKKS